MLLYIPTVRTEKNPIKTLSTVLVTLSEARGASNPTALRRAADLAVSEIEATLSTKPHFSQAEAARLLGVSTTTLDNWISTGLLPLCNASDYKRKRVLTKPLLALATEVKVLRRMGQQRGLLAEAVTRLERDDPNWAKEYQGLEKEASRPFKRGDYLSAAPGPDWGPGD